MVSTNGHDQQRSICLRLRDVLYLRDAVALLGVWLKVRGSTQALLPHSRVSVCGWCGCRRTSRRGAELSRTQPLRHPYHSRVLHPACAEAS